MSEVGKIIGEDRRRLEVDDEAQIGPFGNVSYFELPRETIYVDPVSIREDRVYPDVGSTFILGHPTAGVLGSSRLGYVEDSRTRVGESKIFEDFTEDFGDTAYLDSSNTTASGWGSGSIVFDTGSIVQSLNIGSDIKLSATKINRIKMSVSGSNWINTQGSVTTDGINWFGVIYDVWNRLDAGSTGSEVVWKIIDPTQTGSINFVSVSYKQDDV